MIIGPNPPTLSVLSKISALICGLNAGTHRSKWFRWGLTIMYVVGIWGELTIPFSNHNTS